ncbi:hypothetical protein NP493_276g01035 [Ridgeia piscesae]|uniref:Uncharacterized protein n=1 Tax=Ridgeia piscesae TaxID=27915 RepID=A0AAD9UCG1_RIDPI|nr:hypothetical protein NP493_276g01035 [Ridgeia piscesae]
MALSIQCALRQQRQQHQQRQQMSRMQHLMALRVLVKPHPRNPESAKVTQSVVRHQRHQRLTRRSRQQVVPQLVTYLSTQHQQSRQSPARCRQVSCHRAVSLPPVSRRRCLVQRKVTCPCAVYIQLVILNVGYSALCVYIC